MLYRTLSISNEGTVTATASSSTSTSTSTTSTVSVAVGRTRADAGSSKRSRSRSRSRNMIDLSHMYIMTSSIPLPPSLPSSLPSSLPTAPLSCGSDVSETKATTLTSAPTAETNAQHENLSASSSPSMLLFKPEDLWTELLHSIQHVIFGTRLTFLVLFGPVAMLGFSSGTIGEHWAFVLAGVALIPCAERLSFVTEQVAEHTNSTIGALLNATFGNAPELLISVAALRSGYYRVVQLAMLGSMLTNLMLVFGVACIIGGCRYQVQYIRQSSGNVSVILLLVATAGSLFPAALVLAGHFPSPEANSKDDLHQQQPQDTTISSTYHTRINDLPSDEEVTLCRVNAIVMLVLYFFYLVFQLATHKEEFDDDHLDRAMQPVQRNIACQNFGDFIGRMFSHGCFDCFITKTSKYFCQEPTKLAALATRSISNTTGNHWIRGRKLRLSDGDYVSIHTTEPDIDDDSTDEDSIRLCHSDNNNDEEEANRLSNNECTSIPTAPASAIAVFGNTSISANDRTLIHRLGSSNCDSMDHRNASSSKLDPDTYEASPRIFSKSATKSESLPIDGTPQNRRRKKQELTLPMLTPQTTVKSVPFLNLNGTAAPISVSRLSPCGRSGTFRCQSKQSDIIPPSGNDVGRYCYIMDNENITGNAGFFQDNSTNIKHSENIGHVKLRKCEESDTASVKNHHGTTRPLISLRVGILWLFFISICISCLSDVLVETIDGFAGRMHLSQVFTSMVIIPFFSNVAEQVSAFLFAYRNEMDLCVGVTVGSAIQIATMVLPGSVVIGMFLDRNMTLYFHSFETVCLFFGVIVVAAILQGGTTNWLVGSMLVGIYIMFAAGIWYHELEDLSYDVDSV